MASPPNPTYSNHALQRMAERGVSKLKIEQVLLFGIRQIVKNPPAYIYKLGPLTVVTTRNGLVKTIYYTPK